MECIICGNEIESNNHFKKAHDISIQLYYDTYFKQEKEGQCIMCNGETAFISFTKGYRLHCSKTCAQNNKEVRTRVLETTKKNLMDQYGVENVQQIPEVREKTKQTCLDRYKTEYAIGSKQVQEKIKNTIQEKYGVDYPLQSEDIRQKGITTLIYKYDVDNPAKSKEVQENSYNTRQENKEAILLENPDLLLASDICKLYGQNWIHEKYNLKINIIKIGMYSYIHKDDLAKIEDYAKNHHRENQSIIEYELIKTIKSIYNNEVVENTKKIITPYEIDIYLSDLKLGIEYNSIYWHSIEFGKDKDYHLQKSLMCREKGIRLIHIYEFEDFEQQTQLLKDFILGIDNYPKNDFNKNNLIDSIPEPEIVYKDNSYTVYGAGKLY